MRTISREEARSMLEDGKNIAVVEVLSHEYFEKFHLPGAERPFGGPI